MVAAIWKSGVEEFVAQLKPGNIILRRLLLPHDQVGSLAEILRREQFYARF